MLTTEELRRGARILLDGDPYLVLETRVQTPSARGSATLTKVKLRNVRTGQLLDKSLRGGERFVEPDLERRALQFLYREDEQLVFMDQQSYEQVQLGAEEVGVQAVFLDPELDLRGLFFEGRLLALELPQYVELAVVSVVPGARGDTAHGGVTTEAELSNGMTLKVPLFIKVGEQVRVATADGSFAGRAR